MNKIQDKYSLNKLYLSENEFFDGESYVTFNIVDINLEKMTVTCAVSKNGAMPIIEYDLKLDKDNNLYFEYGYDFTKIFIEDFI